VYFYELHESDDELLLDVLLVHDSEFDEEEFLELVLEARADVMQRFEEDSLIQAIANELERRHGFTHVTDARIRVAINVSTQDEATVIADVDEGLTGEDGSDGYRSILVEADPEDSR
jgi:hypothetical protein